MAEQQLTATLTLSDETTTDVTADATWSSSDDAVATVEAGLVTAIGPGGCVITASQAGLSGTCQVTVTEPAPEPTELTVTPPVISLDTSTEATATTARPRSTRRR